jgi:uncharacterized membrane protein
MKTIKNEFPELRIEHVSHTLFLVIPVMLFLPVTVISIFLCSFSYKADLECKKQSKQINCNLSRHYLLKSKEKIRLSTPIKIVNRLHQKYPRNEAIIIT